MSSPFLPKHFTQSGVIRGQAKPHELTRRGPRIQHDEVFKGCDITYVPIFLGGLMHKCGNTAPIKIKSMPLSLCVHGTSHHPLTDHLATDKDAWINAERLRWARHFSIPMTTGLPPDFPAPSLPIMRVLSAIAAADGGADNQARLVQALDVLFSQHWEHAVATHRPEELRATLTGLFGAAEAEMSETTTTLTTIPLQKQKMAC